MTGLDLGVIGNSIVAALIDRRGRIVWHCLPRFDGDPVFSALLDGEDPVEGFAEVALENFATADQAYLDNTAVLTTTLKDTAGQRFASPTSRRASSYMTVSFGLLCWCAGSNRSPACR